MDTISAEVARKITDENLKGPAIESYVSTLSVKIRQMANEGKSSMDPWAYLGSLRGLQPSGDERKAIEMHFKLIGFKWKNHPGPDPGHPCSRPYTTLSW